MQLKHHDRCPQHVPFDKVQINTLSALAVAELRTSPARELTCHKCNDLQTDRQTNRQTTVTHIPRGSSRKATSPPCA